MIILPAIDIKNKVCVRLYKGDFDSVEVVADSPVETALRFQNEGAKWLHTVDLDGALGGRRINSEIFTALARETNLKIELGGGIRTLSDVEFYLNSGISRVIIGSAAIKNPELVRESVKLYGDAIAVGIDARKGMASADGWTSDSAIGYIELAKQMEQLGVKYIIYTDIDRDGTLSGPNISQLEAINNAVSCNIIASGGVTNIEDIRSLSDSGMYGAICGKSIYKGTLSLKEALSFQKE